MAFIGLDIGATKINAALFSGEGKILFSISESISNKKGKEVGVTLSGQITQLLNHAGEKYKIDAVGVSVPGIYYSESGKVWAPNIKGWEDYPLLEELNSVFQTDPVKISIDSDRACYILGEVWKGNAQGCRNAIFMAVGTGIGAGILIDGKILRGANDIAGCTGWLALDRPFQNKYSGCGCFEYYASGDGLARSGKDLLAENKGYSGIFRQGIEINGRNLIEKYDTKDELAIAVIDRAIEYWGMSVANLISLFNPEKVILGGGVFGPAAKFIDRIRNEAAKWAQPIGFKLASIEVSAIGSLAGLYGAGYLAMQQIKTNQNQSP